MEGLTEEQEMQRAIQMSMSDSNTSQSTTNPAGDFDEAMQDPDFMNSVLGSLSGVDTNDPRIQNVLQGFSSSANSAEEEAKKKRDAEEAKKKEDESK